MCPAHYLTAITLLHRNYMVQAGVVSLVEKYLERKIFISLVNLLINMHYSHPQKTHIKITLRLIYKDMTSCKKITQETAFVVTHTLRQTDIPTSLHSWVTNTPSVKMLCQQQNCLSLHFHKNITCFSVGLLRISQVFSVCCKIVCRWVMTHCCFKGNIVFSVNKYDNQIWPPSLL